MLMRLAPATCNFLSIDQMILQSLIVCFLILQLKGVHQQFFILVQLITIIHFIIKTTSWAHILTRPTPPMKTTFIKGPGYQSQLVKSTNQELYPTTTKTSSSIKLQAIKVPVSLASRIKDRVFSSSEDWSRIQGQHCDREGAEEEKDGGICWA